MQGLADGYFVLPYTLPNYLAGQMGKAARRPIIRSSRKPKAKFAARTEKMLGREWARARSIPSIASWACCFGTNAAWRAMPPDCAKRSTRIPELREEFWQRMFAFPGEAKNSIRSLERAGRVADFLEFAELMCSDALERDESCGGHFREEHQTPDGEALRNDENFAAVFAWEFQGNGNVATPKLHREPLILRPCI